MTQSSYFLGWYESHSFPSGLEFSSDHWPASMVYMKQSQPVFIILCGSNCRLCRSLSGGKSLGLLSLFVISSARLPWTWPCIRALLQVLTDHTGKTWLHLLPDLEVTCLWLCFPNQARSSWRDLSLTDLSHHQGPLPTWDVAAAQQIVDQNLTKLKASVHLLCFFTACSPANSSVFFFKFNF